MLGRQSQHERHEGRAAAGEGTRGLAADGEVARLRAERDAAGAALNKDGRRRARRSRARRALAVVVVTVFAVLLPVTITTMWAHRTVVNTDAYVATVGPIVADPAVQAAVSREVTNEIYATLNPQQVIADALPPKAAALAGPLSNGVKGYLQEGINKILASPKFQQLWIAANRFSHGPRRPAAPQQVPAMTGARPARDEPNGRLARWL